jgi:hypothetical protein
MAGERGHLFGHGGFMIKKICSLFQVKIMVCSIGQRYYIREK